MIRHPIELLGLALPVALAAALLLACSGQPALAQGTTGAQLRATDIATDAGEDGGDANGTAEAGVGNSSDQGLDPDPTGGQRAQPQNAVLPEPGSQAPPPIVQAVAGSADSEAGEPADGVPDADQGPSDGDLTADGRIDLAEEADAPPLDRAAQPAALRVLPEDQDPLESEPSLAATAYPEDEQQPFEPAGLRIGGFRLLPELIASTVLTDNATLSPAGEADDVVAELRPSFRLRSDWSVHSLEAEASALASFHQRFDSEDDRQLTTALRGRLDVSGETSLSGEISHELRQQSRSAVDFPTGATERPEITTTATALTLDHRINRLFTRLGVRLRRVNESAGATSGTGVAAGGLASTNDDFSDGEVVARAGYEVSPGLSLFVEGVGGRRSFDAVAGSDGRLRDATTRELRVGAFLELAPKLRGELAVGHAALDPDDASLGGADGLVLDGSLTWQPSALTTVRLEASSTLEPTTLAGAAGVLGQTVDLEVRHELRRYLVVTAGVGATFSDYQGAALEEEELSARLGSEYIVSREWALLGDYEHLQFSSSEPGRDFSVEALRLGVRLRR